MTVAQGTEALVKQLADEIIKRLRTSYDLVYVDYRDRLTDTQVSALVRGDEWLDESWEFESDSRYDSAKQIIDDLADDIIYEWSEEVGTDLDFIADALKNDDLGEWDRVRFAIEERDTGEWVETLIRHTPNVLLRITALDEDHAYSSEEVTADRVLEDLGLPATPGNVETVNYVLVNASPEYSVLLGYWIASADVSDIYKLAHDVTEVEIVNPYLYLGNPFSGSGFISERPVEGVVRVKREELRADRDAFGYSVDEIYGGLRASDFEAEIRPARQPRNRRT